MEKAATLYLIPGLGSSPLVFRALEKAGLKFKSLEWIEPAWRETFESYVRRLAGQINTKEPFYLGGVSFGGITASEISKIYKPEKLFIISSVKHSGEIPWYLKSFRLIPVHRALPPRTYRKIVISSFDKMAGELEDQKEWAERENMYKKAHPYLLKWQADQAIRWKRDNPDVPVVHIHGDSDRIFRKKFIGDAIFIEDGDHVIIQKQADRIAEILQQHLP